MNTGKAVISIIAAATMGAVIGMLFAPEKGTNNRKKIVNEGKKYLDDMMGRYIHIVEEVNKSIETMKQNTAEMLTDGKDKKPVSLKKNA